MLTIFSALHVQWMSPDDKARNSLLLSPEDDGRAALLENNGQNLFKDSSRKKVCLHKYQFS